MHYGEIKRRDIANGYGVRVSLFVSGCRRHCKNCFNAQTWDFSFGAPFTPAVEEKILQDLAPTYISGLSILGGEPTEPENQRALLPFLQRVKALYPEKTIWCYTGYVLEEDLSSGGRNYCEVTQDFLALLDVLVDGPFVEALKDITLLFRGSKNQRLIDMNLTRQTGQVTPWTTP